MGRFWRPLHCLSATSVWCPRPVVRRLPLLGRQPCIYQHLSGKMVDRKALAAFTESLPGILAAMEHAGPWWRRRNLHPPSRAANATRPYGTCAPKKLVESGGVRARMACVQGRCLSRSATPP